MSETATQLIHVFASLSPEERYAVLMELTRISESDAGPLSDDELTFAGSQLFSLYDAKEAQHGEPNVG